MTLPTHRGFADRLESFVGRLPFGAQYLTSAWPRILSFGIIGVTNTVAYAAICMALIRCGLSSVSASLLAFAVCCPWSYWANARFTFRSRAAHATAVPRFLGMTTASAFVAAAIPFIVTDGFGF